MTADILTALAIYFGTMATLGGFAYYLWNWGDK
jgi:hypothetical protein